MWNQRMLDSMTGQTVQSPACPRSWQWFPHQHSLWPLQLSRWTTPARTAAAQGRNKAQECLAQTTGCFSYWSAAWPHEEFKVKTSMCNVMTDLQYLQLDIVVQKRVWASTVRESEITKHTSHCSRRDPWCQEKRETRSSSVDAGLWSFQHSGALRLQNIHIWDWIKPLGTHYRHAKNTVLPFTYKNGDFLTHALLFYIWPFLPLL